MEPIPPGWAWQVDPGPCRRQRRSCRVRGACPTRRDRQKVHDIVSYLVDDHYLTERAMLLSWRYDVLRFVWARRRRLSWPA